MVAGGARRAARPAPLGLPPAGAEVVARSPLRGRCVFVLAPTHGGPLAAALRALPGAGGWPAPTLLFSEGLGTFALNHWYGRAEREGLAALVDAQELVDAMRALADDLLAAGATPAGAAPLVEHSPADARYAEVVAAVFPDSLLLTVDPPPGHLPADEHEARARERLRLLPPELLLHVPAEQLATRPAYLLASLAERLGLPGPLDRALATLRAAAARAAAS